MDRRTALKLGGMASIGALAGCIGAEKVEDTATPAGSSDGGSSNGGGDSTQTETQGPAGTASMWYARSGAELETIKQYVEKFNSDSRHTIKGSDIADLKKKTTSAIPAGQGPLTFEFAHDWVGDYYQNGFLSGQGDSLDVSLDQFTDAAAGAAQFDGKVLGLPHSAETVGLLYNKDLVDSPPETVEEMVSIMEEHYDPSSNSYGIGYPLNPYFASAWAQAFGGYYFDANADDRLGITLDETIEGFNFLLDTFKPYMADDPGYEAQATVFADGNAPFAINGPWYLGTVADKGINAGVTKLPKPSGGAPRPYTGINLWYFTSQMNSASEGDAAAARAWAEWYTTNEDLLLQSAEKLGNIPVLKSLAGSEELPEKVRGYSEAVQQGVPMPTHPDMQQVWASLGPALSEAFNNPDKVESIMERTAKEIRDNWE